MERTSTKFQSNRNVKRLNNEKNYNNYIFISIKNSSLSALHGFLVCTGLILFSIKSRYLPATDLTLLSLTEVLGGIFWVWLPIFGINEVPSTTVIIGGIIITLAVIYYGYAARQTDFNIKT